MEMAWHVISETLIVLAWIFGWLTAAAVFGTLIGKAIKRMGDDQ